MQLELEGLAMCARLFSIDQLTELVKTLEQVADRLYEGAGANDRYRMLRDLEATCACILGYALKQAQAEAMEVAGDLSPEYIHLRLAELRNNYRLRFGVELTIADC